MQEHEGPERRDDVGAGAVDGGAELRDDVGAGTVDEGIDGDEVLDGFEADLATVESALDALDADDLDAAEALAAGLDPHDDDDSAAATDDD